MLHLSHGELQAELARGEGAIFETFVDASNNLSGYANNEGKLFRLNFQRRKPEG